MNDLKIFENAEFGSIRTVTVDGQPYFIGKDVAAVLGYSNTRDALDRHVDAEDKNTVVNPDGNRGNPKMTIINESGLYSLVLSSKLPSAKRFKRWVTSEVLPAIRQTGGYIPTAPGMSDMEILSHAIQISQATIERQKQQLEAQAPKVLFADSVAASDNTILINDLAKLLHQNGVDIGGTRLFKWMRDNGYLIRRKGTDYNMPTQRSMELGLFRVKETTHAHSDGHVSISRTPKVTGKGQQYFVEKFLGRAPAERKA